MSPGHISSAWQHVTRDCKTRWHMSRSTHQFTGNTGTEEQRKWHQEDAGGESRLYRFYMTNPASLRNKEKEGKTKGQETEDKGDLKKDLLWISVVVQWLRLQAPNTGGPGSTPGQGTRFHTPQLKILSAATKSSHATPMAWHSQRNK